MTIASVKVGPVTKTPLEIHVKGGVHCGKTHVMEIIRQALISHGLSPEIISTDHDIKELDMIDLRDNRPIEFIKQRATITIVDRNERPERK